MNPTQSDISFRVVGLPAPQGSKTPIVVKGRAVLVEGKDDAQRQRHKSWRNAVAETAHAIAEQILDEPLDGPLWVRIEFRLPMPASRPKRVRVAGIDWHYHQPDLSKLVRSTEDALTDSGLIRDDARICQEFLSKIEVVGWTGAEITVGQVGQPPESPSPVAPQLVDGQLAFVEEVPPTRAR